MWGGSPVGSWLESLSPFGARFVVQREVAARASSDVVKALGAMRDVSGERGGAQEVVACRIMPFCNAFLLRDHTCACACVCCVQGSAQQLDEAERGQLEALLKRMMFTATVRGATPWTIVDQGEREGATWHTLLTQGTGFESLAFDIFKAGKAHHLPLMVTLMTGRSTTAWWRNGVVRDISSAKLKLASPLHPSPPYPPSSDTSSVPSSPSWFMLA